jgi:tetratricopeptide (TPR) repeat protein
VGGSSSSVLNFHPPTVLAQARAAMARRQYPEAQRLVESLLRARIDDGVRAPALLIAADAPYALQAFAQAATRYGEFVAAFAQSPEAPRAAMARGWAELRSGQRERAHQAWVQLADRFPADAHAPLALALAAEIGRIRGDVAADGRLIAQYPASPYAGIARLNRSVAALRAQREDAAVRDLDETIRAHGTVVIEERRRVSEAVGTPGEARLDTPPRPVSPAGRGDAIEGFARFVDKQDGESAPYLLHGLVLLAAADRGWHDPVTLTVAQRLAELFPSYAAAPTLLARVGTSAATAGQWAVARKANETLAARFPNTPAAGKARVQLGEALYRTGATAEARSQLEKIAAAGGEEGARALLLLADYHEAAGDRRAALSAYDRLLREHPRLERAPRTLLAHARLAEEVGPPGQARRVLQKAVESSKGEEAAEAAYRLGQSHRAEGQHAAAVEWYMTAAYLAERSRWGSQALLAAGSSLSALGENREALAAYLKLVTNDRETGGEAAYRAGEIYRNAGRHDDAVKMYMTSVQLTAGTAAEPRALVGAIRSLAATGDRAGAEALYERVLKSSGTDAWLLTQARTALRANGGANAAGQGATGTSGQGGAAANGQGGAANSGAANGNRRDGSTLPKAVR